MAVFIYSITFIIRIFVLAISVSIGELVTFKVGEGNKTLLFVINITSEGSIPLSIIPRKAICL